MQPERKAGTELAEVTDLSAGILNVIARAASDPGTDVDKLERLLALQERVLAREAEQAFNEAMKSAQQEMPAIKRNQKNETTRSTYTDLEALAAAMDPIIHSHGFSLSFGSGDSPLPGHYRVTCEAAHTGGHSKHYFADVPADMTGMKGNQNKTATHGFGSTMSYGRRYLKLLIFDIATTDDDGQAASRGLTIDDAQIACIQNMASGAGADLRRFCAYFKINAVPELPVARFTEAVNMLSQKLAQKGKVDA